MSEKTVAVRSGLDGLVARLNRLQADSPRQWGTMSVTQMLAHLNDAYENALGRNPIKGRLPAPLAALVGWLFIKVLPWRQNLPTDPNLLKTAPAQDIEAARARAIALLTEIHTSTAGGRLSSVHPLFGKLNAGDIGLLMWKHTDHHLRQFGV